MCLGCVTPCRRDMTSRREEQRTVEKWESSVDRDQKLCQRCPKKTKKMSKEHNGQRKDTWDFNNFVRGIFVFKVWSEIGTWITTYLGLTSLGTIIGTKTQFHHMGYDRPNNPWGLLDFSVYHSRTCWSNNKSLEKFHVIFNDLKRSFGDSCNWLTPFVDTGRFHWDHIGYSGRVERGRVDQVGERVGLVLWSSCKMVVSTGSGPHFVLAQLHPQFHPPYPSLTLNGLCVVFWPSHRFGLSCFVLPYFFSFLKLCIVC